MKKNSKRKIEKGNKTWEVTGEKSRARKWEKGSSRKIRIVPPREYHAMLIWTTHVRNQSANDPPQESGRLGLTLLPGGRAKL